MNLRESHPNLFTAYIANGTVNLLIGIFGLLQPALTPISLIFIAIFILLGLSTILFTVSNKTTPVRIALISGLFYNSFFVILFLISLVISFQASRQTAYVTALFLGHALATYVIAIEPPINPATMKNEDEK